MTGLKTDLHVRLQKLFIQNSQDCLVRFLTIHYFHFMDRPFYSSSLSPVLLWVHVDCVLQCTLRSEPHTARTCHSSTITCATGYPPREASHTRNDQTPDHCSTGRRSQQVQGQV